jgi:DNA-binding CsgD family transcriptional regulator
VGDGVESRFAGWVELVGDLLLLGRPGMPVDLLLRELRATFEARASWNWTEPDGSFGFHLDERIPGWPDPTRMEAWGRTRLAEHPLIVWFARTRDLTAMTLGRVPADLPTRGSVELVQEELRPVALDQQLSLPYRSRGGHHRAFVLATTGDDFGDPDLLLARRIQPLLALVGRQGEVLASCAERGTLGRARTVGLTGRETAVLELLARGCTAAGIGKALGISTRTVHVHLDHLYRKLSVHDRLMAVTAAREAGLLDIGVAAPAEPDQTPAERRFSWSPHVGVDHAAGAP